LSTDPFYTTGGAVAEDCANRFQEAAHDMGAGGSPTAASPCQPSSAAREALHDGATTAERFPQGLPSVQLRLFDGMPSWEIGPDRPLK
jgi:hypothetical protein